jgi:dTDP-4-dehydrorhamnose reductase
LNISNPLSEYLIQRKTMKILVTGSNGQLGNGLRELSDKYLGFKFLYTDLKELDIASEAGVNDLFNEFMPDAVINCAAYTAVDKAESEKNTAFLINSKAVEFLSKASARCGSFMVHISTDYIFDGKSYSPYFETDNPNPLSVYGKSKYAGELAILNYAAKALIIRTSWLYSEYGNNFVKTIRKLAKERDSLNVVYDQIGTPTYARDLAETILNILPKTISSSGVQIFNYSNEGVASWYDFAKAIVDLSGIKCKINPIRTTDYPQAAVRPFYSVLDKSKIKAKFSIEIPHWSDSLKECFGRFKE